MVEMDEISKKILNSVGIISENTVGINEILIFRDSLLNNETYEKVKHEIPNLKQWLSSSALTSLQKNADKDQKWPLLNLVRQILHVYGYEMIPIRKCDGYTPEGIKKFKRYFQIVKKQITIL